MKPKRKKDGRKGKAKPKAVGSTRSLVPSYAVGGLWEITARPDAEYNYFDIGMRDRTGEVTLIGQTWNKEAAELVVAAGRALAATQGSVRREMDRLDCSLRGILDRCPFGLVNAHLLPERIVDNLRVLQFLACAVLPAQKAQRETGVPASLLLAEAMMKFGYEARDVGHCKSDGAGDLGCVGIDAWFLGLAKHLAATAAVKPVIAAAGDRTAFLEEILKCKAWKPERRADLTQKIIDHDLHECDWTKPDEERDQRQPYLATLSYKERLALAQGKSWTGRTKWMREPEE